MSSEGRPRCTRDPQLQATREARQRFGGALLANPDVHGVGVGHRRREGELTDELVVVVHVQAKRPTRELSATRVVPTALHLTGEDGEEVVVRTDVQQRGVPVPEGATDVATASMVRRRLRPAPGGCSAGYSGTLGAWVWDPVGRQPVALSNRHVFGSVAGTPITQPSGDDGGARPADLLGATLRAATLDASVAAPIDAGFATGAIVGSTAPVQQILDARVGMRVQKTGRTTDCTFGTVDLIDYASGHHGASADLWITGDGADFSAAGDSGAVYLDVETQAMVGLHWGGTGTDGVGHPIRAVFDELGVTVLPAGFG